MVTERERQLLQYIQENPQISQQELANRCDITRSSVAVHISNLMKKGIILGKGYVLQENPYIVVVGGQNMDIFGCPNGPLRKQDSTPGKVRFSPGGVARNIANNLALLGEDVKFITAFGDDANAEQLAEGCRKFNIDISNSITVNGATTSTYLYITDPEGNMELAVSDMEIYEHLTPAFLQDKMQMIDRAALCVADTNISEETLEYLAQNCRSPLFVDTVSTTKAAKLTNILRHIHTLKPNLIEAELLTGIVIRNDRDLKKAAERFLDMGLSQVFISMGGDGVYAANKHHHVQIPCFKTDVLNTTGAGDSFMATLAWAWRQQLSLEDTAKAAQAAAALCISSPDTVNTSITADQVLSLMNSKSAPSPVIRV